MIQQTVRLAFLFLMLSGCSHSIHQVYVSSMDQGANYKQGKWVTAAAEDYVILSFQMDSDYIEKAYKNLEAKCKGRISQVTTEFLTSYQFVSYDQKLILRGFCQKS
jgi:hypothetical protein